MLAGMQDTWPWRSDGLLDSPSEPGRPVPYLDEVALQFPDLVIVAGHIGFPWTEGAQAFHLYFSGRAG